MIHKKLTVEILRNPSLKRKFSPGACTVTDSISLLPRALPCYPTQYNLLSGGFRFFLVEILVQTFDSAVLKEGKQTSQRVQKKKHVFFFRKISNKNARLLLLHHEQKACTLPMKCKFASLVSRPEKGCPKKKHDSRLGGDGNFPIIRGCGSCNLLNSVEFLAAQ